MREFLETCERAARVGGKILMDWRGKVQPRVKGPKDVVTEADLASQEAIRELVLREFPDHDFLGEEQTEFEATTVTNARSSRLPGYRWIVDPLDGTANYVRGLPAFAVSVALESAGEVIAGAVLDPTIDECYTG